MRIDQQTGLISGVPTAAGLYSPTITAFNSGGSGSASLFLVVKNAAPVITSSLTTAGRVGVAFGYQISASNAPASYGASGLPAGLKIDQSTGSISGTPAAAGKYSVTIAAFNNGGSGTATLSLTVTAAVPPGMGKLHPPSHPDVAIVW